MSKHDLVDRLRGIGFEAAVIDGIPYILNVPYDVAERAFQSMGWNRSWGVKNGTFLVENHTQEEVKDGA